jgi:hypothetical protein
MAGLVQLNECFQRVDDDAPRHLLAFKQRFLGFLALRDIAGDLGGADCRSRWRLDRGDAQRNVDPPSIFSCAHSLAVLDFFAPPYTVHDGAGLDAKIIGNDNVNVLADRLLLAKSK